MLTLFFMTFVFWVLAAVDVAIFDEEDLGNAKQTHSIPY